MNYDSVASNFSKFICGQIEGRHQFRLRGTRSNCKTNTLRPQLRSSPVANATILILANDFFSRRYVNRELSEPICRYSIGMYFALDTASPNIFVSSYRATILLCVYLIILAIKIF